MPWNCLLSSSQEALRVTPVPSTGDAGRGSGAPPVSPPLLHSTALKGVLTCTPTLPPSGPSASLVPGFPCCPPDTHSSLLPTCPDIILPQGTQSPTHDITSRHLSTLPLPRQRCPRAAVSAPNSCPFMAPHIRSLLPRARGLPPLHSGQTQMLPFPEQQPLCRTIDSFIAKVRALDSLPPCTVQQPHARPEWELQGESPSLSARSRVAGQLCRGHW